MYKEKLQVQAALPYANGDLHIGNAFSTYIPADIFVRYKRLRGADITFICGSDDHGTPVAVAALQAQRSPQEHAEYFRRRHLEDFEKLDISFDNYHYTSSEENRILTNLFLTKAYEGGYIFQREVEQFYCERDKRYLPDRFVKGTCPYCGAGEQYSDACESCGKVIEPGKIIDPHCAICGTPPVKVSSNHFFFKLSAFSDELSRWLLESNQHDFPQDCVNYVRNWINEGLRDWDITREDYWGFPIPLKGAAPNQYVYVWWDAPIGYIASTWNYCDRKGLRWEDNWRKPESKTIYFIGKDILYHHFLFWPAMLKAAGYNLPSKYVVNGFLTLQEQKISKSRRWLVPLRYMIEKYTPDYFRFYVALKSTNSLRDNDFSFKEFQTVINTNLADNIGNFAHRVLTFISANFEGAVPQPRDFDAVDEEFKLFVTRAPEEIQTSLDRANFNNAVHLILNSFAQANRYLNSREPWKKIKTEPGAAKTCLYLSANFLHDGTTYLFPITPNISSSILGFLSISYPNWTAVGGLTVEPGHRINSPSPVVKKITDDEIEEDLENLRSNKFVFE